MAKSTDENFLGAEITDALNLLGKIVQGAPDAPHPPEPTPAPVPAAADDEPLLVWYRAMKPRTMCKLLWMVLLQWQARRSGGRIHFEEFAALLGVKKEKVAQALRDLSKLGWIEITATETGPRRRIISRTVAVKTSRQELS
ncbi:helix-turn-helix domain-containing protein [Pyramidobacter sp.]|uniref:helix-turn-helix domain-containing protein n=1 Tax=Pyramidobacter sp. TaxID=1943581 RepID=UPI002A757C72|nr:helix-turn-helix domain-containing protein [Pyramidobacter sp.]MDY3212760.1 helix-turn-helix domain-containing protein [Pyramidobacter sp.]